MALRARRTALGRLALAARRAAAGVGSGRRELAICVGAYGVYNLVRGVWGGSLEEGRRNAWRIVALERRLGIDWEPALQRLFLRRRLGMPFWNAFYVASQVVVMPATLFLTFRFRREDYAFVRNLALISWSAGLVWYARQPVAPPRLTPGCGLVDTVSTQTAMDLDSRLIRAFYNPVAAMPSLHVGMAPVATWALVRLTGSPWTRALGAAYPALVTTSIVVTGNHWVLDVAGGLAVVLPAAAVARAISGPRFARSIPRAT
jgi:membrane-associated phospholipid phosphatase